MYNTPLGQVVSVRAEKDQETIRNFTPDQQRIRNEWLERKQQKLKENPVAYKEYWSNMQKTFEEMFS